MSFASLTATPFLCETYVSPFIISLADALGSDSISCLLQRIYIITSDQSSFSVVSVQYTMSMSLPPHGEKAGRKYLSRTAAVSWSIPSPTRAGPVSEQHSFSGPVSFKRGETFVSDSSFGSPPNGALHAGAGKEKSANPKIMIARRKTIYIHSHIHT